MQGAKVTEHFLVADGGSACLRTGLRGKRFQGALLIRGKLDGALFNSGSNLKTTSAAKQHSVWMPIRA